MNRTIKFRIWNKLSKNWINNYVVYQYGNVAENGCWVDPNEIIIQQFTGLTDSAGQDIYEGDIIECFDCQNYFSNDRIKIIKEVELKLKTNLDYESNGGPDGSNWSEEIKIIGNIFENPQLLKTKN